MFQPSEKEEIKIWVEDNVIPKVAQKLHKNYSKSDTILNLSYPEGFLLLSAVIFAEVRFNNSNSKEKDEVVQLVIKRPSLLDSFNNIMHLDALFHNEILFYEKFSQSDSVNESEFPRCFLTAEDLKNPAGMIIVIENIVNLGYKMCLKSYDIPFEYVIAAMQAIGRFHGMSYTMKVRQPEKFAEIVGNLMEYRYSPGETFGTFINLVSVRPVEYLRKKNYDPVFLDKMEGFLSNAFDTVMMKAVTPKEPLATLCHGDFTRSNIFFREKNGSLETMLIDFAMLRYSSPSIDVSTFLYLNCSTKDRNERFPEIFKAYYNAVIGYLKEQKIEDLENYSEKNFMEDYKRNAMFGFVIAMFFLPVIRGISKVTPEEVKEFDNVKMAMMTKEAGGDAFSEELAGILVDMRNHGYLEHVLQV
ncbi:uncharacterized protein LOC123260104 [Cotesia glomerata]|uniref:CHK kinase-like domain-containing protein n=1 Tax=Cotesia glomerata TaxID=32391 RepID=A0AAV7HXU7_COTGL|nr:uncharacterized protein LOC123260104 [Cotesia glomerata]KAH0539258.1 hypothetical protein KQX54_003203 [Cotesia glomerata]